MTEFTAPLTVNGVPVNGGGLLPFPGNYWFVNEATGSDGNTGASNSPLASLAQAQINATANNGDVVLLMGTNHTTKTVNWAKDGVHLIGLTAPSRNSRARISQTGSTLFTPLVHVTAQGCIIANLGTFHGFANSSAQICWLDEGQRNYYSRVQFLGMGATLAAAHVGGRSLAVGKSGQGEHVFEDCEIGLDTIARGAVANASLELLGGTPRNLFRRCLFPMFTSASNPLAILVAAAAAIDRDQTFEDCAFINQIQSSSVTVSEMVSMHASAGGLLMMQRCSSVGATKWGDTGALAQMYVDGGPPTAGTTGLAINPS